jgi:hypothetical protein
MNEDGHVSNSRRGLLAAGLAAAVVGSMGVVWTLNASAEETPDVENSPAVVAGPSDPAPTASAAASEATDPVPTASAAATEATDPVPTPPEVLPWGAPPEELTVADAGANSKTVAAEGADAAPADTSGSLVPEPEYAPKGWSSEDAELDSTTTTVVPPAPPGAKKAVPNNVYFHYALGAQEAQVDGTWANLSIAKPVLAQGDYHTLAELAVQSADGRQIVEVGWNVDRSVNGDSDPHMFVYYWKDRQPSCYNACGFTMYSTNVKPGDTLPVGVQKRFGIQHSGGVWWIAYDSEWIGYFPDSLWNGNYTQGGLVQWFGEVASADSTPCTEMGNGQWASSGSATRIGSISFTNGPAVNFTPRSTSSYYSVQALSDRTFRYGGPGAC